MRSLLFLIFLGWLTSCSSGPEPIRFGSDTCHSCKMMLMDKKFGAEIVTKHGKAYKFDDVHCLLNGLRQIKTTTEAVEQIVLVDFNSPGQFINARDAFLLRDDQMKSPMGSNVAAFSTSQQREKYYVQGEGKLLTWQELIK